MKLPESVQITEVGPRDGFQNIQEWIPTETKLEIIERLVDCGFKKLEVTSFVHPKAVPQMADAKDVLMALKSKYTDISFIALVPNLKGVTNAMEAGADEVVYVISASEHHNFENTKQTIEQSLQGLGEVCKIKGETKVNLAIATAFNCPWTGKVPPENVVRIIKNALTAGVSEIGLGDTIGSANPVQIEELLGNLQEKFPGIDVNLHLHDTRGVGLANIIAALQMGTTRFETSVGGLGGCPFAPGAAGNIATEDLVNMLEGMGIKTGINLEKLMKTVYRAQELLPVPLSSHMAQAVTCELNF